MDFDRDPFFMFSMFAPMTMMYAVLALLVIPFVLYVIARWRAHRDQIVDPQLGLKVALNYFAVTAYQVLLAGAGIFVYAVLSTMRSEEKSSLYRMAFGLIVPAAIVLAGHVAALRRTNQDRFPSVKRLFGGYNLLITGMFGFFGLVFAFQMLLKKGPAGEGGRVAAAMVLVYGSAWASIGIRFVRAMLDDNSAMPPPNMPQASAGSAPPAPSGPTLPSLGGGSFPPIEPK